MNRVNPLISLGRVWARQGTSGCRKCLDEAAAAADGSGEPQFLVPMRLARAEAYWLEGQPDRAAREADLDSPYEAALALYDAPQDAALREALKIFTRLGASAAAQIIRHKMRLLGIRSIPAGPRSATREHPFGLTRREREVLDLICAGHTNAEIAAKLSSPPRPSTIMSPPCW